MASYGNKTGLALTAAMFGIAGNASLVFAASCGAGITARDLKVVDIKPDGKPKIDAGALFINAAMDNKKALNALHQCAANNDAEAMAFLGMYYSGKDGAQALKWYLKADGAGGDVGCNLGKMYDRGEGVPQNDSEAAKWYLKSAARSNDGGCQFNLGLMYVEGRAVPKSMSEAVGWWSKAASNGNVNAQFNLGVASEQGEGVKQDKEQAVKFYTLACKDGHSKGCFAAGVMRFNGEGVQQSKDEGVTLIRKALTLDPKNEKAKAVLEKLGVAP